MTERSNSSPARRRLANSSPTSASLRSLNTDVSRKILIQRAPGFLYAWGYLLEVGGKPLNRGVQFLGTPPWLEGLPKRDLPVCLFECNGVSWRDAGLLGKLLGDGNLKFLSHLIQLQKVILPYFKGIWALWACGREPSAGLD